MKNTEKVFDGLLVLQYRSGNNNALAILVTRHHAGLCRHSYWYTKDVEASKDIVQDSWRVIIRKLKHLKDPNSFKSWAIRIVTRKSLDHVRKNKRERKSLSTLINNPFDEEEQANKMTELKRIRDGIKELSIDQQAVLRLFYTENYSLKEISVILKISTGTVKSRLYHAREKLKKVLKEGNHEKRQGKN